MTTRTTTRNTDLADDPAADGFTSVPAIADHLGVSRMTIYRLVDSGELDAVRVGRIIRVYRASYRAYLRAHAITGLDDLP
jgi:excisionase family DNA binding protein